jgi:magnesium transporter
VRDHLIRVADVVDTMRDYLMDSLDIYATQQTSRNAEQNRRVNRSVARLTAVSTIFLPLTFITGIYEMNFEPMPELSTRYGHFVVLGVLFTLAASMIYCPHRKKII